MSGKGRPRKYATVEDSREAKRVRNRAASKKRKAERAIAEGRMPGIIGSERRLTDEQRVLARRASVAKWRAANRERVLERDAEAKRRERSERAEREGRKLQKVGGDPKFTPEQQREKSRQSSLAYWRKNPERRKENARQYYLKNKEKAYVRVRTRRARKQQSGGTFSKADVEYLWELQGGKCVFCLKTLFRNKFHVDHHVPLALGGANDRTNLRLLHKKCNLEKGARDPVEHARRNGLLCW